MSQRVLSSYEVGYFRCCKCGLLQTEEPYWLDQAYSSTISALDTGAIFRNTHCTRLTLAIGRVLGIRRQIPCLDFGGGYGVFTRMMRDAGENYFWSDKYGPNNFARGFEGSPKTAYRLVTAFEVFEHLANVHKELTDLFSPGHDFVLVSTLLCESVPTDWWYFVPESGQHVAFYSCRTMERIGMMFRYRPLTTCSFTLFIREGVRLALWRKLAIRWLLKYGPAAHVAGSLVGLWRMPLRSYMTDHRNLRRELNALKAEGSQKP